jgi:hypothetical protein
MDSSFQKSKAVAADRMTSDDGRIKAVKDRMKERI